jgi:uncharacterized protein (TIGR02145 family)
MAENLNVSTFRNGDPIPEVKSTEAWDNALKNKQPAYFYKQDVGERGKFYNWYALIDSRGITPLGWRIPTEVYFKTLVNSLGGDKLAAKKLKSSTGWSDYPVYVTCNNCSYWTEKQRENNPCTKCQNTQRIVSMRESTNGDNSFGFNAFPVGIEALLQGDPYIGNRVCYSGRNASTQTLCLLCMDSDIVLILDSNRSSDPISVITLRLIKE